MTRTLSTALLGFAALAMVSGFGWWIRADAQALLLDLLGWIEGLGALGPAFLILLETLTVILVLPGLVLTLGGGYLFGFVAGTLYMMAGTTLGAILAFLIARWFFGQQMRRYILEHPKLDLLSEEFTPEGWKVVLLTRLIPLFPYKLSNYFFGLTEFRLWHFVLSTVAGLLPITMVLVYAGTLAHASGHMTPDILASELRKLTQPASVLITHTKPGHLSRIEAELKQLNLPGVELIEQDKTYTF